MTSISYWMVLGIVDLLYGIWRYRKNRVIAVGAITLGVAGLAFALSKVRGLPDWLLGVPVAVFLILSVFVLLLPIFYLVRWLVGKLRRKDREVEVQVRTP